MRKDAFFSLFQILSEKILALFLALAFIVHVDNRVSVIQTVIGI
jgi:hypothetical protein